MVAPVLEVQGLATYFFTREGVVKAVNGVTFALQPGEIMGLVGESGCGKTVTGLSILRIVPYPGRIVHGSIRFEGKELLNSSEQEMRQVRGEKIAMVFQDPAHSLNPVMTIGEQIEEAILSHWEIPLREARERTLEAMHEVGLPNPRQIISSYPYELSGGMCQRVMMAVVLTMRPRVLIADEPTSALDTTLQAEMMDRLLALRETAGTAIILITHNLGLLAKVADRIAIMYAGDIAEEAETTALFRRPTHPYTYALLQSVTRLDVPDRALRSLPGSPPNLIDLPDECPFIPRCSKATSQCRTSPMPAVREVEPGHTVACYNPIWHKPD
ncbi:MAG: ABC transporter ATP-binding protein [Chloroflexi bacterium]|nr:ABC transporter ATP-binding protein [Chloroflexota bacterium]